MARKVNVVICGKVITLRSDEEEAHLQRIARYIDQKMAELTDANASVSIDERLRTNLIALNIANDYFKAMDKLTRIEASMEEFKEEYESFKQESNLLRKEYDLLKGKYTSLQAEHDEFIEAFDKSRPSENVLPIVRTERKVGIR